jgi:HK97 gp10 family phage protein
MPVSFGTNDLDQLTATFEAKQAGMDSRTSLVVRKAAFDVERYAKQNAAVDTGFMRSSIHTVIQTNNWRTYGAEVIAEAAYSYFVEAGTSRMAPQPFMGPALDRVEPGFVAALEAIADPL